MKTPPKRMTPSEIRALRERLGLTQGELAERLGLAHRQRVGEWEAGVKAPSGRSLILLRLLEAGRLPKLP